MLAVAKKLEDKLLFLWLNQILNAEDAIANDVCAVCVGFLLREKQKLEHLVHMS